MISRNIYCVFLILCLQTETSGEEKAEEVKGVLGESVTFQLKTSEQFTLITWSRNNRNNNFDVFAFVKPKQTSKLEILFQTFHGRLNISEDCKRLQVSKLVPADSGTYRAQIQQEGKDPLKETFGLQVYKRLSEADLTVSCERSGNVTFLLNCSAGQWEDGVKFSWASASKSGDHPSGKSLLIRHNLQDHDLNITCTAENPVGSASRTVSIKHDCDAQADHTTTSPVTMTAPENGNEKGSPKAAVISIVFPVVIAVLLCLCIGIFLWRKKKGGTQKNQQGSESRSELTDCMTLYAQIGNVPEDASTQKTKQRREPTKANKETPQTVYTTVHHPKLNLLQTDDEKMQREGRGATKESNKTVYSEINPQENEDKSINTVYETVNHPKPPKAPEYNEII